MSGESVDTGGKRLGNDAPSAGSPPTERPSDLVGRLKEMAVLKHMKDYQRAEIREAATEIERLTAALREMAALQDETRRLGLAANEAHTETLNEIARLRNSGESVARHNSTGRKCYYCGTPHVCPDTPYVGGGHDFSTEEERNTAYAAPPEHTEADDE